MCGRIAEGDQARFGLALAAALLIGQQTGSAKARNHLGRNPSADSVPGEFEQDRCAAALT